MSLLRRRLDLAGRDLLLDHLELLGDERAIGLRQLRRELAVADAAVLHAVDLVEAALEAGRIRLVGGDRLVDRQRDVLQGARQDVLAEEALVGVHADAPRALLLGRVEAAETTGAGRLEDDAGSALDLVQRGLLALRLV